MRLLSVTNCVTNKSSRLAIALTLKNYNLDGET